MKTLKYIQEENRKAIIMACNPTAKNYKEALEREKDHYRAEYFYTCKSKEGTWSDFIMRGPLRLTPTNCHRYRVIEALGKPPTLNRVLRAVGLRSATVFLENNILSWQDNGFSVFRFIWDLTKPTLEQQEEETQRAIHDIITNNK